MSYTTSARLSRGQTSVAIIGGTGNLGFDISKIFITPPYKPFFSHVTIITRNSNSDHAKELESLGATLFEIPGDAMTSKEVGSQKLNEALRGVDVLVDTLNHEAGDIGETAFRAALEQGVRVYIPSEFGVDHRLNDFPEYDHPAWTHKRKKDAQLRELVRESGKNMKVIAVYTGLFMEMVIGVIGPMLGFDVDQGIFTAVGSSTSKFATTYKPDIGRALAELSILSMLPSFALEEQIPDYVRIAGDNVSMNDVKEIVQDVQTDTSGMAKEIEVKTVDAGECRMRLKENFVTGNVEKLSEWIRVIMGEGKLDFSTDNSNEVVNPGGKSWRWKTLREHLKETATQDKM